MTLNSHEGPEQLLFQLPAKKCLTEKKRCAIKHLLFEVGTKRARNERILVLDFPTHLKDCLFFG